MVPGTDNIFKMSKDSDFFFSLQAKVEFIHILLIKPQGTFGNPFHGSDTKLGPLHFISFNPQNTPMGWALS